MGIESRLRGYTARHLRELDSSLRLVGVEHPVRDGRLDILARIGRTRVGIELKARPYATPQACAQVLRYLRHVPSVYFVAPKVRLGVYEGLRAPYEKGRVRLFEVSPSLRYAEVSPDDLDDSRPFPRIEAPEDAPSPIAAIAREVAHDAARYGVERFVSHPLQRKILRACVDHFLRPQRS